MISQSLMHWLYKHEPLAHIINVAISWCSKIQRNLLFIDISLCTICILCLHQILSESNHYMNNYYRHYINDIWLFIELLWFFSYFCSFNVNLFKVRSCETSWISSNTFVLNKPFEQKNFVKNVRILCK